MIPFNFIPKELRTTALVVGTIVVGLTIWKLYTDIQINKEKLEDLKEN